MKNVSNAKYVVETICDNGNVFLHGPFRSRTVAEEYIQNGDEIYRFHYNDASPDQRVSKVREVFAPTGWTRSVK